MRELLTNLLLLALIVLVWTVSVTIIWIVWAFLTGAI